MNIRISSLHLWLENHPKTRQWFWFIGLWFGGLLMTSFIAYPIKWLLKTL